MTDKLLKNIKIVAACAVLVLSCVIASDAKAAVTDSAIVADSKESRLEITRSRAIITAGKSFRFKAESSDENDLIKWSVSKKNYARISANGKLKAIRAGKIRVTASIEEKDISVSVKLTIKPKKIVAIDAGHQARANNALEPIGPGASVKKAKVAGGTSGVYTHVPEYKLNLSVAKKLQNELIRRGYKVVMIRNKNNVNISNMERAKKANETSDICIRLHADAAAPGVSGASALYPGTSNKYVSDISKASKSLSECVLSSMCNEAGTKNRGLFVRNDLTGTNWSKIPVTLIEMGFMTNKAEDIKMQKADYQTRLAEGMAEGIEKYFGYK